MDTFDENLQMYSNWTNFINNFTLTREHNSGRIYGFFFMINKQAFPITVIKSWGGPIVNPLVAHASS
jgi:hypothetical protein